MHIDNIENWLGLLTVGVLDGLGMEKNVVIIHEKVGAERVESYGQGTR